MPEYQNKTNLIDDIGDIDDNDVVITDLKNLPLKPCVMFSGFSMDDKKLFITVLSHSVFFFY